MLPFAYKKDFCITKNHLFANEKDFSTTKNPFHARGEYIFKVYTPNNVADYLIINIYIFNHREFIIKLLTKKYRHGQNTDHAKVKIQNQ